MEVLGSMLESLARLPSKASLCPNTAGSATSSTTPATKRRETAMEDWAQQLHASSHPRTLSPTCERHWDAKWITRIFSVLPFLTHYREPVPTSRSGITTPTSAPLSTMASLGGGSGPAWPKWPSRSGCHGKPRARVRRNFGETTGSEASAPLPDRGHVLNSLWLQTGPGGFWRRISAPLRKGH